MKQSIVTAIVIYLLCSFVALNLNPNNWSEATRFTCALIIAMAFVFINGLNYLNRKP